MSPSARLITDKSNITYFSNFTGSAGFLLLTPQKNYLFTDSRYIERAKHTIKKGIEIVDITRLWRNAEKVKNHWQKLLAKHQIHKLGIEEDNLTISQFKRFKKISRIKGRQVKFINISGEIEKKRETKSLQEISYLQKSQDINGRVFEEIKKIIQHHLKKPSKKPLRELDLAWKIRELGHQYGADDISFDPIVCFGAHSSRPHHAPDQTALKKGDPILIDMGMKYKGYCSDMTRIIFTAKPTAKQQTIYNLVLKAQLAGIKAVKTGSSGAKADKISRGIIIKAGYGGKYGHAGGHGIGLDVHEIPSLTASYKKPFKKNSIVTVEPGIYLEGEFGVRIEDMILVTKTGNKNLTKVEKELDKIIMDPLKNMVT